MFARRKTYLEGGGSVYSVITTSICVNTATCQINMTYTTAFYALIPSIGKLCNNINNFNLCQHCYMSEQHDVHHSFLRFDCFNK